MRRQQHVVAGSVDKGRFLLRITSPQEEDKAAAVYQMLYAKTTPYIPAAFLQIPLEVTVLLDEQAASRL